MGGPGRGGREGEGPTAAHSIASHGASDVQCCAEYGADRLVTSLECVVSHCVMKRVANTQSLYQLRWLCCGWMAWELRG